MTIRGSRHKVAESASYTSVRPSTVVQAVIAAFNDADWEALRVLVAEDAEIESGSSPGRVARGRDAYIAQLKVAHDRLYDLSVFRVEDVDSECCLLSASARVPVGGGFEYRTFHWLVQVREGRLTKSQIMDTVGDARTALRSMSRGSSLSARLGTLRDRSNSPSSR
jgi:ketosteroid isomerase-like protein